MFVLHCHIIVYKCFCWFLVIFSGQLFFFIFHLNLSIYISTGSYDSSPEVSESSRKQESIGAAVVPPVKQTKMDVILKLQGVAEERNNKTIRTRFPQRWCSTKCRLKQHVKDSKFSTLYTLYHVLSRESRNCGKNRKILERLGLQVVSEFLFEISGLLGVEPKIVECPNIMSISLGNPGQVIHPGVQLSSKVAAACSHNFPWFHHCKTTIQTYS